MLIVIGAMKTGISSCPSPSLGIFSKGFLVRSCFLSLVFLLVPAQKSQASIAVEPYLGAGAAYFNNAHWGVNFGSRLGYSRWGLMTGIDIGYSVFPLISQNFQELDPTIPCQEESAGFSSTIACVFSGYTQKEGDYDILSYGPSVSFSLPLIIDVYASILWSNAWRAGLDDTNNQGSLSLSGPGFKIGVSYLSLPFLRINLELQSFYLGCSNSDSEVQKICLTHVGVRQMFTTGLAVISVPISTGFL